MVGIVLEGMGKGYNSDTVGDSCSLDDTYQGAFHLDGFRNNTL
jgi:hypothetical protein